MDGTDLRLAPDSFREDPLERTAIGKGLYGKVHFLWPKATELVLLTVLYTDLSREHARRLIAALGPRTLHDKTLNFDPDPSVPGVVVPGGVTLRVTSAGRGRWNVSLETPARPMPYAIGGAQ